MVSTSTTVSKLKGQHVIFENFNDFFIVFLDLVNYILAAAVFNVKFVCTIFSTDRHIDDFVLQLCL